MWEIIRYTMYNNHQTGGYPYSLNIYFNSSVQMTTDLCEIIWYLSLTTWLISLSMMLSSSINAVGKGYELLLSLCWVEFHCVNIPWFFDPLICWWDLGCFQYLAIVNCAAMNIGVHRFFWIGVSGFLGCIIPAVELLGQKAVPFLVFWGNSILFSTVAIPVCIPTKSGLEFPFLHNFASTSCFLSWLWWPFSLVWSGISLWF